VPTTYYTTPTEVFRAHHFAVVIWANHLLRAAITAMQQAARTIRRDENLLAVEAQIAPVGEVFRLQGADELQEAEGRSLPRGAPADTIISCGDVLFDKYLPQALAEEEDDLVVALDTDWRESANRHREADYAQCSLPHTRGDFFRKVLLRRVAVDLPEADIHGE